jgi:hypothetical protein
VYSMADDARRHAILDNRRCTTPDTSSVLLSRFMAILKTNKRSL